VKHVLSNIYTCSVNVHDSFTTPVRERFAQGGGGQVGGREISEAQRLKSLEDENRRLKHLVADLNLDKEVPKAVISKNGWGSQLNGKL
jgi:hypothetical protein